MYFFFLGTTVVEPETLIEVESSGGVLGWVEEGFWGERTFGSFELLQGGTFQAFVPDTPPSPPHTAHPQTPPMHTLNTHSLYKHTIEIFCTPRWEVLKHCK